MAPLPFDGLGPASWACASVASRSASTSHPPNPLNSILRPLVTADGIAQALSNAFYASPRRANRRDCDYAKKSWVSRNLLFHNC
ncbi:unnamed protein product [Protopolystoma xenopodis]|uniref:Uncharacterized protein n=1 Tax=Protopolystoma xenopodis TaxID=117903 RepID=A0A448X9A4_9PLAT|nr:unnamed protein product [Protopolystoma xenopodis]